MKKFSLMLVSFFLVVFATFHLVNLYYDHATNKYYDEIGKTLSLVKNQGLILQEKALERSDNIGIYGSSELSGVMIPTHPDNFFEAKRDGFQVNLVGRGYSQSIIHAINFAALGDKVKNKKIVIILSPQWFAEKGLTADEFNMNISELQFYQLFHNNTIDESLKLRLASRVNSINTPSTEIANVKYYSYLYSKNSILSKVALATLMPYYDIKYNLLLIKDKINTYNLLKEYKNKIEIIKAPNEKLDWEKELADAEVIAKEQTTNNNYGIINDYFTKYVEKNLQASKNSYSNLSYSNSPEYEDLKLLLDICKETGIKPLIIGVPMQGQWYDYCGFPKERRDEYYNKVKSIISPYGFAFEDLSKYEYEKYFLKDIMHLGWKGWLQVDKAIDKYYNEN